MEEKKNSAVVKEGYRRMTYELSDQALDKIKHTAKAFDIANSDLVDAAILTLNINDTAFRAKINQFRKEQIAKREMAMAIRRNAANMTLEDLAEFRKWKESQEKA